MARRALDAGGTCRMGSRGGGAAGGQRAGVSRSFAHRFGGCRISERRWNSRRPLRSPGVFIERALALIFCSRASHGLERSLIDLVGERWRSRLDPRLQAVSYSVLPLGRQITKAVALSGRDSERSQRVGVQHVDHSGGTRRRRARRRLGRAEDHREPVRRNLGYRRPSGSGRRRLPLRRPHRHGHAHRPALDPHPHARSHHHQRAQRPVLVDGAGEYFRTGQDLVPSDASTCGGTQRRTSY